MKPRISMITLGTENLEKSISFYKDGLGLPQLDSPPSVAFFNLTGTWLGLFPVKELAKDSGVDAEGSGFRKFTLSYNVASEKEVEETIAEATAAGATVIKPPQKAFWGGFHGFFSDLDGHIWEVAYNPFAWVGPADE